jgi:hypothetical protein
VCLRIHAITMVTWRHRSAVMAKRHKVWSGMKSFMVDGCVKRLLLRVPVVLCQLVTSYILTLWLVYLL